ncbi:hypothetical protein BDV10DRAFT_87139 [Aspergillus recurvatus]
MFGHKLIDEKARLRTGDGEACVDDGRRMRRPPRKSVVRRLLFSLPTSTANHISHIISARNTANLLSYAFLFGKRQDRCSQKLVRRPITSPGLLSAHPSAQLSILQILTGLGSHGQNPKTQRSCTMVSLNAPSLRISRYNQLRRSVETLRLGGWGEECTGPELRRSRLHSSLHECPLQITVSLLKPRTVPID